MNQADVERSEADAADRDAVALLQFFDAVRSGDRDPAIRLFLLILVTRPTSSMMPVNIRFSVEHSAIRHMSATDSVGDLRVSV